MEITREWYENEQISSDHSNLEIRQIYVWVVTKDNMVAIVTKSNGGSHFPGGHPEVGENNLQTAQREVYEETGLDISSYISYLKFFGYYLIEENKEKHLQIRYLLQLPLKSKEYNLFMNEKSDEERPVVSAQWVELNRLVEYLPWVKGLEEYRNVIVLVSNK